MSLQFSLGVLPSDSPAMLWMPRGLYTVFPFTSSLASDSPSFPTILSIPPPPPRPIKPSVLVSHYYPYRYPMWLTMKKSVLLPHPLYWPYPDPNPCAPNLCQSSRLETFPPSPGYWLPLTILHGLSLVPSLSFTKPLHTFLSRNDFPSFEILGWFVYTLILLSVFDYVFHTFPSWVSILGDALQKGPIACFLPHLNHFCRPSWSFLLNK